MFLDPPYRLVQEYAEALKLLGTAPGPLVMVHHDSIGLEESFAAADFRVLRQGETASVSFAP